MLRYDKVRRTYSAEFKHRTFGRIHIHLRTTVKTTAMHRHSALEQLLDTGEPVRDLVEALRARKLTIEAVYECVRAKRPFDTLRAATWPSLGEGRDRYLAHLEGLEGSQGSAKTTLNAKAALQHAVTFFGADRRLEAITPDDVVNFKAYLLAPARSDADKDAGEDADKDAPPSGAGLHHNTVALYLTKFGALYTWLQEREDKRARQQKRVPATLFSPLDRDEHVPVMTKTRVRFLVEAEAEAVLAAAPASLVLLPALGIFAGLRAGEIQMLRPELDVDLERSILFIQAREGWRPKYGKNREVPISDALRPYVERHLATQAGRDYLFPGREEGVPRSLRNLEEHFARIVADAGLEPGREHPQGVTLHTLRHTFASWLVMAGADLLTVSRLLGHATIKQVQETYAHLSPGHLKATVDLLSTRWAARTAAAVASPSSPSSPSPLAAPTPAPDAGGTPLETP